ncbi:uncharacterized protein [Engystomops pustulosus]|uniref:uncharacterized protein isoform X2 n=1 Tax=Engystomops pustulosus TaxID=76066 RepID=UPI003AFA5962
MNNADSDICPDCEQRSIGSYKRHELYCYDVYLVSAPNPNSRQRRVDMEMNERIVDPLEQRGFKCYLGSRNISGGAFAVEALSNPITIIPITIVPVFRDSNFAELRKFLIIPELLDRIVFLRFDSTRIEPPLLSKNSFSISIHDPDLLQRLIDTIERKCTQIPLPQRKRKYEMSKICSDSQSSGTSSIYEFQRSSPFRRSDISRVSIRIKPPSLPAVPEDGEISIESTCKLSSLEGLIGRCCNTNESIRNCAAIRLKILIQENIVNLCNDDSIPHETFEKCIRSLVGKYDSIIYMKLYFWILVAIFCRIYKCSDLHLKKYMKTLTLAQCKISQKPLDRLCQQLYLNLAASLHAKIKVWPNRLDNNKVYVKKLENCLSNIDIKSLPNKRKPPNEMIKDLTSLPRDMTHIFIVAIAAKLFQKNFKPASVFFFSQILKGIGRKHWGVFLDVFERITEYTHETRTEGALKPCMDLLQKIDSWTRERRLKKNKPLPILLQHVLCKLVYHPDKAVRDIVAPRLLDGDFTSKKISKLGNSLVKVPETLVDKCIRAHMDHYLPDLLLNNEIPTKYSHASIYEARTPEGEALVYVFKQRTWNDILQTNSTDDAYQRFIEMSRYVQECQVHDNIVALRSAPQNSKLPFFAVEQSKPLLQFLHAKENQLTWLQMMQILIDITAAVAHCHRNNIILCDITPASFIIVSREDGSFTVKLGNFLLARRGEYIDSGRAADDYIDDIDFHCIQGDPNEKIAAYFSSPESLSNKTFSRYTEVWMLAATFYSVLLYGRQPFEELAHLNGIEFVKEITSEHTAKMPKSIPSDLWNIVKTNLDFCARNRKLTDTVLQELNTYKTNLGTKMRVFHSVVTVCSYINPEDILRGYVNAKGQFTLEEVEEPLDDELHDSLKLNGHHIIQTVTVRMSLNTRRKILQLNHENILKVNGIKTDCYKTKLVSNTSYGRVVTLSDIKEGSSKDQLFSYFKQMTLGLQELHRHNIVHCDLRCKHFYVNPDQGTIKIGNFGRAVSLDDPSKSAIKLMPSDAQKWSAPEVRKMGMYSEASDIFSLGAVFLDAISSSIKTNCPLESFQHLEDYYQSREIQGECGASVIKLVKIILKCWNPNPIKRPTLDTILDDIQRIIADDFEYCATLDETPDTREQVTEEVYETALDPDFSIKYFWKDVIYEFENLHGLPNDREAFLKVREMPTYGDIGVPPKKRTRSKQGILL